MNLEIRRQFKALENPIRKKDLIYFDSGASSLTPENVAKSVYNFLATNSANVHRGAHFLSEQATNQYEETRIKIQSFINAKSSKEIIFTKGTTDSINLVAKICENTIVGPDDEIVLSVMEHHSNIVPWRLMFGGKGPKVKVIPLLNESGDLDLKKYQESLSPKTKLVGLIHVSNTLGTINPIKKMIQMAKEVGAITVIDGAQAVPHLKVDIQNLGADFYAFSGHKIFGPNGIGILYGKEELLEKLPPYQGGGSMINRVDFHEVSFNDLPYKFEAGTPPIDAVVGLAHAVDFINEIGLENIEKYEAELVEYAVTSISQIEQVKILPRGEYNCGLFSFNIKGLHAHDVGTFLDQRGIAIRVGHHCTQPLLRELKEAASCRASFSVYNTKEEIDVFVNAVKDCVGFFL